ncbi:MAG TPA: amidohydrolase family protein [Sedimentisphaerales bacterium]|nr:amidohydrolase family protein [Sedimentisphaerales bacterium]
MKIPGLVDLQVNGYKGVDFSSPDLTEDDFALACRAISQAGTTAFLPTLITSPTELYERNLPIIARVSQRREFCGRLLGIHLEGPFISPQEGARGSHNPQWITKPSVEYLSRLVELAGQKVKMITIAADVEGAPDLARCSAQRGISVSLGHHMAGESDLHSLHQAGAKSLTHLGNGVPANLPRHDNPIWAGLCNDDLYATLITDGCHLPAGLVKTFIRAKGASRCIVVSDSSPLAGMPPGRYKALGNDVILDQSGRIYNPATGYLVGSSATMLQCMNYLASLKLLSPEQLLALGFYNPLKLLGLEPDAIQSTDQLFFDEQKQVFGLRNT